MVNSKALGTGGRKSDKDLKIRVKTAKGRKVASTKWLERYERQKVDGLWMRRDQVDETMRALLGMPFERRVAHPCIGKDRADLVLPGCAIFEAIRREWPTERVRVADRGLREGILISLMDADRMHKRPNRYPRRQGNGQ